MTINRKDATAGALFIVLGIGFGLYTWSTLDIGTNLRMGPGYFPLVLAGALFLLGVTILFHAFSIEDEGWGHLPWRGMFFILLGPLAFGLTLDGLGLVPALALITFITSFASMRVGPVLAIALTVGLTIFCVAVFSWGLVPIRLFGPWMNVVGLGN
jgi:hypothetical protein